MQPVRPVAPTSFKRIAVIGASGYGGLQTLRLLQAFQHIRNHPDEVCPANWTPGEKTMNPDPVKSKEFFAAVN